MTTQPTTDHLATAERILRKAEADTTLGDDPMLTNALLAGVLHGLLALHDLIAEALDEDEDAEDNDPTVQIPAVPGEEPADERLWTATPPVLDQYGYGPGGH